MNIIKKKTLGGGSGGGVLKRWRVVNKKTYKCLFI
jgi:hypothetical protein